MDMKTAVRQAPAACADDPLWYKDAVIYQLHVKSFADSNDDGVGDFRGLITRLDYIAELGVNAIWLLPFYPSPRRDDGYDIADYRNVHPDYGTLADLRAFIAQAHARGIRVISELIINHTSDQHPWFQRARRAKPHTVARDFYVWSNDDRKYADTRIIFCDTEKSNWSWDEVAGAYYWHRFYSHQPDLNFDNPQVLRAVMSVMRFWLDMGIDGLRLDAVPYLIEREGTSNENLPETHALLKRFRAELDRNYRNRMLIAEANQWPEDAQEYFGAGDECHMAFHFPLMPRMYMAIAQEDRFPITDILRQTPAIPPGCQWAIFLRNHDELTLEMVTDSERDYLWRVYAADSRARLNLGIRRRLAPLLERDRRCIELMSSLLFSMPGTPVIYYGDEIGMGDNIHLGDRDGVRTPMQWSSDRNGGFSRADPERLVLPIIMDPVSGFGAINVEAQRRDPHSLLNWTRRMLAVRQRRRVFGRGSMRFLHPGNRKVLAYLRELEGETLLCVANLARSAQAVELDLSEFEGKVPIEVLGDTAFPPIGQLNYLLTLPPYGFYWFELRVEAAPPAWREAPAEMLPEHTTLVLRRGVGDILEPRHRAILEHEILPAYLGKRRWFAAAHRHVDRVRIAAMLPGPDASTFFAEIGVGDTGARYLLPLAVIWEDENPPALAQRLAFARVRWRARIGFLTDAFALESFARALLAAVIENRRFEAADGSEVAFNASTAPIPSSEETQMRWLLAENSNSSLVLDEAVVIKLLRRIEEGSDAESEVSGYLARAGYRHAPVLLGTVSIEREEHRSTFATLHAFVRNQGDGWSYTQDYFRRAAYDLFDASERDLTGLIDGYATFAATIGTRLAELHHVLAQPSDDPAFAPMAADTAQIAQWTEAAVADIDLACAALAAVEAWPHESSRSAAVALCEQRERIHAVLRAGASLMRSAPCTRVHGDFHLRKVLISLGDIVIIDFEGAPEASLAQRRRKTSPLTDVASLLRSLDYASASIADETDTAAGRQSRRAALLEGFRVRAAAAFLAAYAQASGRTPDAFVAGGAEYTLLHLFLVHKAAREVRHELTHRPGWLAIPLLGLQRLCAGLLHTP